MFVPLNTLGAQSLIIKLSDVMRSHGRLHISLLFEITVLKGFLVTVLLGWSREGGICNVESLSRRKPPPKNEGAPPQALNIKVGGN